MIYFQLWRIVAFLLLLLWRKDVSSIDSYSRIERSRQLDEYSFRIPGLRKRETLELWYPPKGTNSLKIPTKQVSPSRDLSVLQQSLRSSFPLSEIEAALMHHTDPPKPRNVTIFDYFEPFSKCPFLSLTKHK
jgi:hypothetical protein